MNVFGTWVYIMFSVFYIVAIVISFYAYREFKAMMLENGGGLGGGMMGMGMGGGGGGGGRA
jgi:hypothetical protein